MERVDHLQQQSLVETFSLTSGLSSDPGVRGGSCPAFALEALTLYPVSWRDCRGCYCWSHSEQITILVNTLNGLFLCPRHVIVNYIQDATVFSSVRFQFMYDCNNVILTEREQKR